MSTYVATFKSALAGGKSINQGPIKLQANSKGEAMRVITENYYRPFAIRIAKLPDRTMRRR